MFHYQELDTEVLVMGGGAAGVMAATAAARNGARTLLCESQGCLGGSRTSVGVDTFYGFFTPGETKRKIVGGLSDEIINKLRSQGALIERQNTYGAGTGLTYDVEALKIAYEELVLDAGVTLLYHTFACGVESNDGQLQSILIANKGGLHRIRASVFVDTTGDADLIARSGGSYVKQEKGTQNQSLTTIFFMGNVDLDQAGTVPHAELVRLMKEANASGTYFLPREDGSYHRTPHKGVIQANMVRVKGVDATDPFQLTLAEVEGRKQAREYARFLQDNVPGFEEAFMIGTGAHIGVRETRKIVGQYTLTEEDVIEGRKFEDGIACCGAPIEDHHSGAGTRWVYVRGNGYYQIPYRSLVPKTLHNIIAAGRCLSATHAAQASVRNSAQAMAMGQAAGTAAALAVRSGSAFADLDITSLQQLLEQQGAIIR